MKSFFNAVKIAALYIGAFVGAGFAGGKEIKLYFGSSDVFTIALSSIVSGLFCFLFLLTGSKGRFPEKIEKVLSYVFALSGVVTSGIMLAGLNELTGSAFSAIATALLCLVCASFKDGVKNLCVVVVPLMTATLIFVAKKVDGSIIGSFLPLNAVAYSAMNMFFEFGLMREEGRNSTVKEDALAGVLVAAVSFVLIALMRYTVANAFSSLPFFEAASSVGGGTIASVTLFAAVASTVAGCFSLCEKPLSFLPRGIRESIVAITSLCIATCDFEDAVDRVYPVISVAGICLTVAAFLSVVIPKSKYLIKIKVKRKIGEKKEKNRVLTRKKYNSII